jgi:fatty-acyl-CoA synthase
VRAVDAEGRALTPGGEGRLEVRGPAVSPGYLGEPERAPGAWFRTGDTGWLDVDGYLFVAGRADAVIVTGGENVHPEEVEATLREYPGVADARVFGEPDAEWGRRVVAQVAPSGPSGLDPAELEAFARSRLAPHQVPKRWEVVARVERSEMGKPAPPAPAPELPG